MDQRLNEKIAKREQEGTVRSLSLYENFTDFFSNDYLGLSKIEFTSQKSGGSTGSRLISGNSVQAEQCEQFLAQFFQAEAALVYNSGYDANLGFFGCVPQKGDTVIFDEKIHASIRDGVRLSFAQSFSFRHNDTTDLRAKINKGSGAIYVAVESLYSMDGDMTPIGEIAKICQEKGAYLVVDEAHASGVFGMNGKGIGHLLNNSITVFARIVTFGKAYGYHGACILGEKDLIHYLINFSRSFIYTTAPSAELFQQIEQRVNWPNLNDARTKLQANISYFRTELSEMDIVSEVNSPIQVIRLGNIEKTKRVERIFLENCMAVKAIYSPTVAKGEECLRICIHSFNTQSELDQLISIIKIECTDNQ